MVAYVVARRWSARTDFSLAGLLPFGFFALALAVGLPRAAYGPMWIVLIDSLCWIAAVAAGNARMPWSIELAALLAAVSVLMLFLPIIPGDFMGDGSKSVAILAGTWALVLAVVLPAIDGLVFPKGAKTGP